MRAERLMAIAQALGILVPGAAAIVWTKMVLPSIDPLFFVGLQLAVMTIFICGYTFILRREGLPRGLPLHVWIYVIWIGVSNFMICRPLFILALERLPATTNVYLVNFVGVVTMALSAVVLRERPSLLQIGGALVALAGLRVFFRELPAPEELQGVFYAGLGVLSLATTNIAGRKLGLINDGRLSPRQISSVASVAGGIPVVLWGLSRGNLQSLQGFSVWGAIVLSGAALGLGVTVWIHILRVLRSYEATVLASAGVVFTALFSIPMLGEQLERHQVTGIALMIAGLALAQLRRSLGRQRQSLSPPPPLE